MQYLSDSIATLAAIIHNRRRGRYSYETPRLILTEAGEYLTTEAGDRLLTEGI